MKWTTEKPTKKGWYWYKNHEYMMCVQVFWHDGFEMLIVHVIRSKSTHQSETDWHPLDSLNGYWSDQPIPEPGE